MRLGESGEIEESEESTSQVRGNSLAASDPTWSSGVTPGPLGSARGLEPPSPGLTRASGGPMAAMVHAMTLGVGAHGTHTGGGAAGAGAVAIGGAAMGMPGSGA